MKRIPSTTSASRQGGTSLVELMVALTLSLLTVATMLGLMSASLGRTADAIHMTKLTDDLRIAMLLMSRDVRRSNYTADSVNCYANPDCGADGTLSNPGDIQISEGGDCFVFRLDRDSDGDATEDSSGGFRRQVADGVGVLQAWTGDGVADCDAADDAWVTVTDPSVLEITQLQVDDLLSFEEVIFDDGEGSVFNQRVRRLRISLAGQLRSRDDIQRNIEDVVKLRNNFYM